MFNFIPAEPKRKADGLPADPIGQAALKKARSKNKQIIKKLRKYMEKLNEVCLQNNIEHEYIESLPELIDIAAEHIKLDDFEDMHTIDFLKLYGFSKKIIYNFFYPFFSGIFLEDRLET